LKVNPAITALGYLQTANRVGFVNFFIAGFVPSAVANVAK